VQARIHQPPAARRPTQPAKRCHSAGAGGSHDDRFLVGLGPEKLSWAGLRIGTRIQRPISAKMSLVARQLSDGLSATKCGSQNRKDVTDFHSCDPQKMSYEQGEACHLHTAPARRGFCAEMSQNQTPCNPIRASSFPKRCHGRVDARTFGTSSARVPRSPKMSRGRSAASPRFSFSQTAPIRFRRKAPTPSAFLMQVVGASNVNRVLDQRRVLGRERKTQQPP